MALDGQWSVTQVCKYSVMVSEVVVIAFLGYQPKLNAPLSKKRGHTALSARLSVCNLFVSDQKLENALTYLPQTKNTHPFWAAEEPYWFLGYLVKCQYQRGQIRQNRFRSITRERLNLPSSNHTSIMGSIWTLLMLGSLGRSLCHRAQMCQIRFGSITIHIITLSCTPFYIRTSLNWACKGVTTLRTSFVTITCKESFTPPMRV